MEQLEEYSVLRRPYSLKVELQSELYKVNFKVGLINPLRHPQTVYVFCMKYSLHTCKTVPKVGLFETVQKILFTVFVCVKR